MPAIVTTRGRLGVKEGLGNPEIPALLRGESSILLLPLLAVLVAVGVQSGPGILQVITGSYLPILERQKIVRPGENDCLKTILLLTGGTSALDPCRSLRRSRSSGARTASKLNAVSTLLSILTLFISDDRATVYSVWLLALFDDSLTASRDPRNLLH